MGIVGYCKNGRKTTVCLWVGNLAAFEVEQFQVVIYVEAAALNRHVFGTA